MSVTQVTKFHVSVKFPPHLFDHFGESAEFERLALQATKLSSEAGTNRMDNEEWANFWSYHDAVMCEQRLQAMIPHFEAKYKEYQNENEIDL